MRKVTNKLLDFFQQLGKAIMMPISVLPAAGLLLRLGKADVWGPNLFGGNGIPWMEAAGYAIIGQMPLLFAIGIAVGLAEDNNGAAGLAGAVGYFILTKVAYAFAWQLYPYMNNWGSFDIGVLAGVVAGVVSGILYNRYNEIRLPQALGFFGGKRFIPIITSVVMIVVGLLFGLIWPIVQENVTYFGNVMANSGVIGAFGFGFLNRLLIPFGLHHVLNSVFWFQFGEFTTKNGSVVSGDILRFLNGDTTAGVFQTGFFPIMMFALPAACLAMILAADKSKRKNVIGILGGVAFTSFLTGVTEPIEFTFMFIAPALFFIHALLTGICLAVSAALGMRHGFSFSAGLIDYLINFNLADKPIVIIAFGIVMGIVYFLLFYIVIKKFDIQTPGREREENKVTEDKDILVKKTNIDYIAEGIMMAVGGKENIEYVDSCVTRVRLRLKDISIIDRKKLKSFGASNVVRMGDNNVQIIIGTTANLIVSRMKRLK